VLFQPNIEDGFPPPAFGSPLPVTNVRETDKKFWQPWLEPTSRCLVPATSFSEYDDVAKRDCLTLKRIRSLSNSSRILEG
jgi:putative SOS response-associated peptidase YedK